MSKEYRVKSALVVVPLTNGQVRYVYQGSVVPADADQERVRLLCDLGLVVEEGDDAEALGDNTAYPVSVVAQSDLSQQEPEAPKPPSRSASKYEWGQYAIREHGWTQDEVDRATKDDLIGRVGG